MMTPYLRQAINDINRMDRSVLWTWDRMMEMTKLVWTATDKSMPSHFKRAIELTNLQSVLQIMAYQSLN